jgi:hypothetical protein
MRKPPTWDGDILLGPPVGLGHAEQKVHPIGLVSPLGSEPGLRSGRALQAMGDEC